MKTSSEVNFEKRGRLEDHKENCSKCGACVCWCYCGGHKPSRLSLIALTITILYALFSLFAVVHGAEIPYTYQTTNLPHVQDINIHSDLIGLQGALLAKKKKSVESDFNCNTPGDDIQSRRINNPGDVTGSCLTPLRNKEVGFIRQKNGNIDLIDWAGTDGIIPQAIADNDKICGQYFTPFVNPLDSGFTRFHGFCRNRLGAVQTIDVPLTHAVTVITGVNRTKQIGNYFQYDPVTNETGQWHCFMLDNGNFTNLERPGATFSFCSDLNNDGVVLYDDDEDVFIVDDGIFYKIARPTADPGFTFLQVDPTGLDDDLRIVGSWRQIENCGMVFPQCRAVSKNFIATPD